MGRIVIRKVAQSTVEFIFGTFDVNWTVVNDRECRIYHARVASLPLTIFKYSHDWPW